MGELAGVGGMLPNPHLLIRPFLSREAVLSSRIEGTVTTLGQLFLYEADSEEVQIREDTENAQLRFGGRVRFGADSSGGALHPPSASGISRNFAPGGPRRGQAAGHWFAMCRFGSANTGVLRGNPLRAALPHHRGAVVGGFRPFSPGRAVFADLVPVGPDALPVRRSTRSTTAMAGSVGCFSP